MLVNRFSKVIGLTAGRVALCKSHNAKLSSDALPKKQVDGFGTVRLFLRERTIEKQLRTEPRYWIKKVGTPSWFYEPLLWSVLGSKYPLFFGVKSAFGAQFRDYFGNFFSGVILGPPSCFTISLSRH